MTKLNINEAILTCHSGRVVTIEFANDRGEWEKDFPSILSAKAWCEANGLTIISPTSRRVSIVEHVMFGSRT